MTSGILCDYEIASAHAVGNIVIKPYNPDRIQPNSYDVSLGKEIIVMYQNPSGTVLQDAPTKVKLPYTLRHGEFVLGTTEEIVEIRDVTCAELAGKSTLARHGVGIHLTAGFIDCGFKGNITLEIVNYGNDFVLKPGMLIGQLVFHHSQTPRLPYGCRGNHYQGQSGPTLPYDLVVKKSNPIKELASQVVKKQGGKKHDQ